jgi:hypothetical protein
MNMIQNKNKVLNNNNNNKKYLIDSQNFAKIYDYFIYKHYLLSQQTAEKFKFNKNKINLNLLLPDKINHSFPASYKPYIFSFFYLNIFNMLEFQIPRFTDFSLDLKNLKNIEKLLETRKSKFYHQEMTNIQKILNPKLLLAKSGIYLFGFYTFLQNFLYNKYNLFQIFMSSCIMSIPFYSILTNTIYLENNKNSLKSYFLNPANLLKNSFIAFTDNFLILYIYFYLMNKIVKENMINKLQDKNYDNKIIEILNKSIFEKNETLKRANVINVEGIIYKVDKGVANEFLYASLITAVLYTPILYTIQFLNQHNLKDLTNLFKNKFNNSNIKFIDHNTGERLKLCMAFSTVRLLAQYGVILIFFNLLTENNIKL